MCCRPSRRRGSCLFLLCSVPPPQLLRIPPPGSKIPGLGLGGASQSDSWRNCLLQVDRGTHGRTGGRRRRGGAARARGGPRPRGRSGGTGIGGPGEGGTGRAGGGGIRAASMSILRAVAVAVAATAAERLRPRSAGWRSRESLGAGRGYSRASTLVLLLTRTSSEINKRLQANVFRVVWPSHIIDQSGGSTWSHCNVPKEEGTCPRSHSCTVAKLGPARSISWSCVVTPWAPAGSVVPRASRRQPWDNYSYLRLRWITIWMSLDIGMAVVEEVLRPCSAWIVINKHCTNYLRKILAQCVFQ